MSRLHNKVCLITGAAQGIGLATAETFAREGAIVVLADLKPEPVAEAVSRESTPPTAERQ